MPTQTDDLYDDAMNAAEPPKVRTYFGQIDVDLWRCVLVKGEGKIVFDPDKHSADQKRTAIDLTLTPLASSRFHDPIKRGLIAESTEWTQIIRPSLAALGIDLRALSGRYVQIEMVENGQTYTDKKTGETKKSTTFKFVHVFKDEQEAEAAAAAFFAPRQASSASTASDSAGLSPASPAPDVAPTADPQKATAAKFLPGLWNASNGDVDVFLAKIKGNGLTAKYFDLESPEVVAVVSGQAA